MGDLGFVAAGEIQGRIDNGLVEDKDRIFFPADFHGEPAEIRVQADAEQ